MSVERVCKHVFESGLRGCVLRWCIGREYVLIGCVRVWVHYKYLPPHDQSTSLSLDAIRTRGGGRSGGGGGGGGRTRSGREG